MRLQSHSESLKYSRHRQTEVFFSKLDHGFVFFSLALFLFFHQVILQNSYAREFHVSMIIFQNRQIHGNEQSL